MNKTMLAAMQKEAAARYPNEACGLVVKRGKRSAFVPCKNVAEDPQRFFALDPVEYSRVADQHEILGVWHSHVNIPPTPSEGDRAGCETSGVTWYITGVSEAPEGYKFVGPTVLQPTGFEMPYLERPYVPGVFDCYQLARDFYKREFGITLANYRYREEDGTPGRKLFVARYAEVGFKRLVGTEPKRGDLFLIQTEPDVPSHIAIYIGDDMIMHHCHDRLSRRDIYGGHWHKHTTHHLRHKDLL